MISSESLNLYYQAWYGDTSLWARLSFEKIGLLSSRSRSQLRIIKRWLFSILSELLIFFQLNLVWWYIFIRWIVLLKDWNTLWWSQSRLQKRFRMNPGPVNVHMDHISSAAEPSVTKLGMVMHYCDATSWAKVSCKKICWLSSSSGWRWRLIWSDMTFLSNLLNCWSYCN